MMDTVLSLQEEYQSLFKNTASVSSKGSGEIASKEDTKDDTSSSDASNTNVYVGLDVNSGKPTPVIVSGVGTHLNGRSYYSFSSVL